MRIGPNLQGLQRLSICGHFDNNRNGLALGAQIEVVHGFECL
jgi:hypothetical protein